MDILDMLMENDSVRKQPRVEEDTTLVMEELTNQLLAEKVEGPGDEEEEEIYDEDFEGFTEE